MIKLPIIQRDVKSIKPEKDQNINKFIFKGLIKTIDSRIGEIVSILQGGKIELAIDRLKHLESILKKINEAQDKDS